MCDVVLGMLACKVQLFVLLLYEVGVRAGIVTQLEPLSYADVLCAPVEISQVHRTVHSLRYGVVAHLPFSDRLARAFGSDAQVELSFGLLHFADDAAHYRCSALAVHRNAAPLAEYGPERPEEELLFDHHVGYVSQTLVVEVGYQKVGYAGVRYAQNDALLLRSRSAVSYPAELAHYLGVDVIFLLFLHF